MTKTITIFGSSAAKENSPQWQIAYELGRELGRAGFNIANGGYAGTMRAAAKGAKEAGVKTIGITTAEFADSKANEFIDEECRAAKWHERFYELVSRGDGFAVLDGGTGTLVELMVVWEMANKKFHRKPIVILGEEARASVEAFKLNPEVRMPQDFYFAETPTEAVKYLKEALSL
jgi:uncharacterized protein (TIGR00730 family)